MCTWTFFAEPEAFLAVAGQHLAGDPVVNTVVATVTDAIRVERAAGITAPVGPSWWALASPEAADPGASSLAATSSNAARSGN